MRSCTAIDGDCAGPPRMTADHLGTGRRADDPVALGGFGGDSSPERSGLDVTPIHHLCLFKLGIPLGELWYTQELADGPREHDRSRFLLTAPPL
jgi:hypothetical protein